MHLNESPILTPLGTHIQQMYTDLSVWVQEGLTSDGGHRTPDNTLELALLNPLTRLLEVLTMEIKQEDDLKAFSARVSIIDLLHGHQCHPFFEYKIARSRELGWTGTKGDQNSVAFAALELLGVAKVVPPDGTKDQVFEDAVSQGWQQNMAIERHGPDQVMERLKPDDGIYKWPFLRKLSDEALADKIRTWWQDNGRPYKDKPEDIVTTILAKAGVMLISEESIKEMATKDHQRQHGKMHADLKAFGSTGLDLVQDFFNQHGQILADSSRTFPILSGLMLVSVSGRTNRITYQVAEDDWSYSPSTLWEPGVYLPVSEEDVMWLSYGPKDKLVKHHMGQMKYRLFQDYKVTLSIQITHSSTVSWNRPSQQGMAEAKVCVFGPSNTKWEFNLTEGIWADDVLDTISEAWLKLSEEAPSIRAKLDELENGNL